MKARIHKRDGRWAVRLAPEYLGQHAAEICAEMNAEEGERRSANYLDRLRKALLEQQLRGWSRVMLGYDKAGPGKDLTVIAARPAAGKYIMGREVRVCPGLPDENLLFTDGYLFANELTLAKIEETVMAAYQLPTRGKMR